MITMQFYIKMINQSPQNTSYCKQNMCRPVSAVNFVGNFW